MLRSLHISNLAIVESLAIDFGDGFNVITGETGAGKSILIRALSLLAGYKAHGGDIRTGAQKAVVTGLFELSTRHPAWEVLLELGCEPAPALGRKRKMSLILRRQLSRTSAKSQAWINDIPVTIGSLKRLGLQLIDICGQHESQKWLDQRHHLSYLDRFLPESQLLEQYQVCYERCHQVMTEVLDKLSCYEAKLADEDYWRFRLDEMQALNPDAQEFSDLVRYEAELGRYEQDRAGLDQCAFLLNSGGSGSALSQVLLQASKALQDVSAAVAEGLILELEQLAQGLDDASFRVERCLTALQQGYRGGDAAVERLASYRDQLRKCRVDSIDELLESKQKIDLEVRYFEEAWPQILGGISELKSSLEALICYGQQLSKARQGVAQELGVRLSLELGELHMTQAGLKMGFEAVRPQSVDLPKNLQDLVACTEFPGLLEAFSRFSRSGESVPRLYFRSHSSEDFKPLQVVASGGEVSRLVLALKNVMQCEFETCLMVFDEIDTGISGQVADLVGRKLRKLARCNQVLCVSHLPQVAAYAQHHLLVHKVSGQKKACVSIKKLQAKQRRAEIARLLSAGQLTQESLVNAASLLKQAKSSQVRADIAP